MTLAALLFEPDAGVEPDDVVVIDGDTEVTRAELTNRALALRDALVGLGLESGRPVAVMLGNNANAVAALFGVWRAGGVHVPLNPRLTDDEVGRLLDEVGPAAAVTSREHAARFSERGIPAVVIEGDAMRVEATESTPAGKAYAPDTALIQLTSGTTGPPKPVLLTHSSVLAMMDGVIGKIRGENAAGKRSATPNLIPVSLSVWAGIYNVLFAYRVGAPVVLMERFDTAEFAALVARHSITSVVLPPAAMAMLSDDDTITSLEPLKWVRSISAPLSPFQARRFHDRFGVGVLNSYGQTELGGEIIGWNAADWREWGESKLGAVGRPHAGIEARDVDGELWVRAEAKAAGYANGSAGMDERITDDGWFRTGDVGHIDEDGFVWIDGRVSDQINRGGMKVTPAEVEEVLRAASGVREAAVVGVPDDRLGEVPVAFIVGDEAPDAAALETYCREHLAPWKIPVRFITIDALPRNDIGKVLKRELVKLVRI
jgi:long-chain acyl-CoA synthetase